MWTCERALGSIEKQKAYHMEMNVINHLMSHTAVVLQNVVILGAGGDGQLLCHRL